MDLIINGLGQLRKECQFHGDEGAYFLERFLEAQGNVINAALCLGSTLSQRKRMADLMGSAERCVSLFAERFSLLIFYCCAMSNVDEVIIDAFESHGRVDQESLLSLHSHLDSVSQALSSGEFQSTIGSIEDSMVSLQGAAAATLQRPKHRASQTCIGSASRQ